MKSLNEFLNEKKNYGTKVGNLSKKDLESIEALRSALEKKTKNGIIEYKEEKTLFGKVYPSRISIFTYGSSPNSRLSNQMYVELTYSAGKIYLYGFRSINADRINAMFGNKFEQETQGLSNDSHYFSIDRTNNSPVEIKVKDINDILNVIEQNASKAGKAFADFYKGWKNPD